MGFSPGEFYDFRNDRQIHWEGNSRGIMLWGPGELEALAALTYEEARKALDQLKLLVEMHEGEA